MRTSSGRSFSLSNCPFACEKTPSLIIWIKLRIKEVALPKKILGLLFIALLFLVSFLSSSDEPFCKQVANYTMNVVLDTEMRTITGDEFLTWTNDTEYPTDEVWFHLYWNAFQNNMSTFMTEAGQRGRGITEFEKNDWGFCHVNSIHLIDKENFAEVDLSPAMEFQQPDNDNIFDQTVFSMKLPDPVEPGQTIEFHIKFFSKVPRPISRTGVYKDNYFIAQWFPKIGVFENEAWNCHQFHTPGEFFADYGTYDIKITLPSSMIVGATGEHRERVDNGDGTTTHRFVQHSVHDFAWTASPHLIEIKEDFEFAPGKTTEIALLLQPYHKNLRDRYMNAVKNAIKYASLFYGDYPYTTVTCVDPGYNSRSGGMEYPTFFTGGAYFITRKRISRPEGVTIHEFGHGYFYGLVGSNEFENAWMDEGFTSFLDTEIYYAAYENPLYSRTYFGIPFVFKGVSIPIESDGISRHRLMSNMDNIQRFAWNFMESGSYGANSYSKAELMLRTLKRYMGKDLFADMIKSYSQHWWFKHPKPKDFYDVVSEFASEDMSWLLDQLVYGSGKMDYAIGSLSNQRSREQKGWFNGEFKEKPSKAKNSKTYESEVLVRRLGEVKIPVEVLVVFDDGSEIQENWDGQYRWKKFHYAGPNQIVKAVVDPEFKLVLDVDRTNNSMAKKTNKLPPVKWTSRWLIWLQHAMEFFTIFGG